MELRHLRYFVAVAEDLHVTRAAAKLGIAQPPLTQQIKGLERELGVALFARAGRGVALTNAGLTFLEDARKILGLVSVAAIKARDASAGLLGRLAVGFTESASFHPLVTRTIRAYRASYPKVALTLQEHPSTELIESLAAGNLDVAFVRPPFPSNPRITFHLVAEENMVAAVSIDDPLASMTSLRLRDLQEQRFILYPRKVRPGLADAVIEACRQSGFEPIVGQEAPQLSSTINLVAAGMGISIVPEGLRQVRPQAVSYLPVSDLPLKAYLGLAQRTGADTPMATNFKQLLDSFASVP